MHICLVTSKRPFEVLYGGEQRFTISFSHWLKCKGQKVTIVGRKLFGIEVAQLNKITDNNFQSTPNSTQPPRVLHLPYPIAVLGMLCVSFLLLMKIIDVNHKKRISVIHAQDSYAGLAGLIASRLLKVPFVIHSHGLRLNTMSKTLKGLWKRLLFYENILEIFSTKNADAIITVNRAGKRHFVKNGVKREKIHVIPVGIDVSNFELRNNERKTIRKELGIQSNVALGFIGRLSPEKNLINLLAAFYETLKQKADIKLILVGAGPMNGMLKKLVYARGITDRIIFTGIRYDVNKLLTAFDIFILPSYSEGCPTALLEAMAATKAIIASDIPSIREIVRHNEEAILVGPSNIEALKRAILLLYNNPDLRTKLGRRARERTKLYDVDRVYGHVLKVYEELVGYKQNKI